MQKAVPGTERPFLLTNPPASQTTAGESFMSLSGALHFFYFLPDLLFNFF